MEDKLVLDRELSLFFEGVVGGEGSSMDGRAFRVMPISGFTSRDSLGGTLFRACAGGRASRHPRASPTSGQAVRETAAKTRDGSVALRRQHHLRELVRACGHLKRGR